MMRSAQQMFQPVYQTQTHTELCLQNYPPHTHTHPSEAESFCCNHTQLQATKAAAIAAAATGGVRHVTKPKA